MPELIKYFLQHATATGSRSSILSSLAWIVATVFAGLLGAVALHAEWWVVATLLGVVVALSLATVFGFVYGQLKNPDSLRSEQFALRKMEIEHASIGDTRKGFADTGVAEKEQKRFEAD